MKIGTGAVCRILATSKMELFVITINGYPMVTKYKDKGQVASYQLLFQIYAYVFD